MTPRSLAQRRPSSSAGGSDRPAVAPPVAQISREFSSPPSAAAPGGSSASERWAKRRTSATARLASGDAKVAVRGMRSGVLSGGSEADAQGKRSSPTETFEVRSEGCGEGKGERSAIPPRLLERARCRRCGALSAEGASPRSRVDARGAQMSACARSSSPILASACTRSGAGAAAPAAPAAGGSEPPAAATPNASWHHECW
eukprot:scaffold66622_cov22-Tisochrysis_lutea.AAC.1